MMIDGSARPNFQVTLDGPGTGSKASRPIPVRHDLLNQNLKFKNQPTRACNSHQFFQLNIFKNLSFQTSLFLPELSE
jgi:hypothetical protein